MKIYHYSNGFYEKLKKKRDGIWFTTSPHGYNGQSWLFRYEVGKNFNDLDYREYISEKNTSDIQWYICSLDEINYDNILCLNDEFAPLVKDIVTFRNMIDNTDFKTLSHPRGFCSFPKQCCGDTANLLWKYLQLEHNGKYNDFLQVKSGVKSKDNQSHAWVEFRKRIIIDITADQFPDIDERVIITSDKKYYEVFKNQMENEPDFYKFRKEIRDELSDIFTQICNS